MTIPVFVVNSVHDAKFDVFIGRFDRLITVLGGPGFDAAPTNANPDLLGRNGAGQPPANNTTVSQPANTTTTPVAAPAPTGNLRGTSMPAPAPIEKPAPTVAQQITDLTEKIAAMAVILAALQANNAAQAPQPVAAGNGDDAPPPPPQGGQGAIAQNQVHQEEQKEQAQSPAANSNSDSNNGSGGSRSTSPPVNAPVQTPQNADPDLAANKRPSGTAANLYPNGATFIPAPANLPPNPRRFTDNELPRTTTQAKPYTDSIYQTTLSAAVKKYLEEVAAGNTPKQSLDAMSSDLFDVDYSEEDVEERYQARQSQITYNNAGYSTPAGIAASNCSIDGFYTTVFIQKVSEGSSFDDAITLANNSLCGTAATVPYPSSAYNERQWLTALPQTEKDLIVSGSYSTINFTYMTVLERALACGYTFNQAKQVATAFKSKNAIPTFAGENPLPQAVTDPANDPKWQLFYGKNPDPMSALDPGGFKPRSNPDDDVPRSDSLDKTSGSDQVAKPIDPTNPGSTPSGGKIRTDL